MGIWTGFWLLGLIWGSSFMLIRVGVESVHPLHLVFLRVGIAAVGLCLVVIFSGKKIPRDLKTLAALFFIGVGNTVVPFLLITWGEQSVESSMASVLQATAALFTLVIAHFAFADERITPQKILGLMLGFIGVIVLSGRNLQDGNPFTGSFAGQMAIVLASLFYAIFTTYSRKLIKGDVAPIVIAAATMLTASYVTGAMIIGGSALGVISYAIESQLPPEALPAILTLAIVNTFFAYVIFYEVVRQLGAAKASMVTYVVPVVGLILGIVVLSEPLDIYIVAGAALIFSGIGIVNVRLSRQKPKAAPLTAGD